MVDVAALEARLSEYDFIVAVDKSGSMGEMDAPNGRSRWEHMQETVTGFARDLGKLDSDGIDLVLFGGSVQSFQGVTPDKIKEIWMANSPRGGTPLAEALTACLKLAGKSAKKDFILVITDGVPDDPKAAADVIRAQANKQTADDECTILFVQVGRDPSATAYLAKLDDGLNAKFDIVDAMTIAEAEQFNSMAELVIKAIND